jgi:dihydropyrimidinase
VLDIVSSDHCGYSFAGERGKRLRGEGPFPVVPNGIPGLAARLPLMFSEGVAKNRINASEFVRLTAFNPARLFGLHPRKGTIAPGADADLALWDPGKRVTLTNHLMQHTIDHTPYEGIEVVGWPVMTIARGQVVMRDGRVQAEPGQGRFLARGPYEMICPRGVLANDFNAAQYC